MCRPRKVAAFTTKGVLRPERQLPVTTPSIHARPCPRAQRANLAREFLGLTTASGIGTMPIMKLINKVRTIFGGASQFDLFSRGPFASWFTAPSLPELTSPLPEGKLRLHLFSGNFASLDDAMKYCFHAEGDAPEQITVEQPDAFIDTGFVEVVHRNIAPRLAEFLSPPDVDRTITKMKGASTLIIITEDAFGGFPYALVTTKNVFYLGPVVVDV
ncbi:MAG: hypothetical protein ACI9TA_000477 [Reinekea sp.]|jgi:hypothetical protein